MLKPLTANSAAQPVIQHRLAFGSRVNLSLMDMNESYETKWRDLRVVKDFLPLPDQLVLKEESVKVTISFEKSTVYFLRKRRRSRKPLIRE